MADDNVAKGLMTNVLGSLRRVRRASGLSVTASPGGSAATLGLILLNTGATFANLYLLKLTVDAAIASRTLDHRLAMLFAALGGTAAATILLRSLTSLVQERHSHEMTDHFTGLLHRKSVELDLEYYEQAEFHEKLHRAQTQAAYRPSRIADRLVTVFRSGTMLAAASIAVLALQPQPALLLAAAAGPFLWVKLRVSAKSHAVGLRCSTLELAALYLGLIMIDRRHAAELRLLGIGQVLQDRYGRVRAQVREARSGFLRYRMSREVGAELILVAALLGATWLIVRQALAGAASMGDLVLWVQLLFRSREALQEFLNSTTQLVEDGLFLEQFFEFLDLPVRMSRRPPAVAGPRAEGAGLRLEDVWFAYPGQPQPVIDGLNLTIEAGEHLALIGENGSGKTTLAKLLCRLYDPQSGRILLDGIDLREYPLEELRRRYAFLFQDFHRYEMTVRDNIWLGDTRESQQSAGLDDAARMFGVERLAAGAGPYLDMPLGARFNKGRDLSMGQWQRVALARFAFRDAQILLLDEPTSFLDPAGEQDALLRLRSKASGRTAVLICHRLYAARQMKRIVLLQHGSILEQGSHESLMRRDGAYRALFTLQESATDGRAPHFG